MSKLIAVIRASARETESVDTLDVRSAIRLPSAINDRTMPHLMAWLREHKDEIEGADISNLTGQYLLNPPDELKALPWWAELGLHAGRGYAGGVKRGRGGVARVAAITTKTSICRQRLHKGEVASSRSRLRAGNRLLPPANRTWR
jgi:hypothetical protein